MFPLRDDNEDDKTKKVTPTSTKEFKAYVRFSADEVDAKNADFGRDVCRGLGAFVDDHVELFDQRIPHYSYDLSSLQSRAVPLNTIFRDQDVVVILKHMFDGLSKSELASYDDLMSQAFGSVERGREYLLTMTETEFDVLDSM